MEVKYFGILSMQISLKVMISCVITTLKVNEYQRKSDLFRINFIIGCQLIKKKSDHASARVGPTECILLDSMTIS